MFKVYSRIRSSLVLIIIFEVFFCPPCTSPKLCCGFRWRGATKFYLDESSTQYIYCSYRLENAEAVTSIVVTRYLAELALVLEPDNEALPFYEVLYNIL
jgi:hypothetical protein